MTSVQIADKSGCTLNLVELDGKLFPNFSVETFKNYRKLPLRDDDVILCAYPKSGTHWLWEVTMMLLLGKAETIPCKKSLQMIEFAPLAELTDVPSPRVLNTHVHYDALPHDAYARKTKIVWVARNPKDVAVSLYNHHVKLEKYYQYSGTFRDWLDVYLEGKVEFGSWFDYINSWESVINGDVGNPIHVIMYEDMKRDPVGETTRLAEFLRVTLDPDVIKKVAEKCDFSKMAVDKKPHQDHADIMFRKGTIGDWKNTFTVAQNEAFDAAFQKHMKDSKFNFQFTW